MRVHVVGAGKMGLPMALHLLRGGHAVSVYDTQADRLLLAREASHVPLPQTAATLQLMHAAIAQWYGGEDYAAIIKSVERAAGLEP